jgi:peroxiredoxin Q/BCP
MTQLAAGDLAPDFSLPGDAGGSISLRAMRGTSIVLYFYPRDDSGLCVTEAIAFNGLRAQFIETCTQIIGISLGRVLI